MNRLNPALVAAAGVLVLMAVLTAIGPKRVMAALGYTPVRDVDNPAIQPFQKELTGIGSFTVPPGKRLVVDHVTGSLIFASGGGPEAVSLTTVANGVPASHWLHTSFVRSDPLSDWYNVDVSGGIYADPNTSVPLGMTRVGTLIDVRITVSGHLVNLP